MTLGLRPRLLLATLAPTAAVALAAGLGLSGLPLVALALIAVLAVGGGVWALTVPFERLRLAASESLRQAGLADAPAVAGPADGTGDISHAVAALLDELSLARVTLETREQQFHAALTTAAQRLTTAARDYRQPPTAVKLESPWPDANVALSTGIQAIHSALTTQSRRAAGLQAILSDLPEAVVVVDAKMNAQFLNPAAERLFGHLPGRGLKQPLKHFLIEESRTESTEGEQVYTARPEDLVAWVQSGKGGTLETLVETDAGAAAASVSCLPAAERKSGQSAVLVVRDLSQTKRAEANVRHLHRRLTGQRLSLLVAKEGGAALETIRTQAGLLAQAAKQSGQRERFIPKLDRILEEVNRQELVIDLLGWLGRLTTTSASEPDEQEVRLKSVADDVTERLTAALAERGNRVETEGDAGWLVADEARMGTMMTGVLMHANQSCEGSTISVQLGRRSSVNASDEYGEVIVRFAAPAPSQALVDDVREPFRRPNSGVLDATGRLGFLLGLAVAERVANQMGGVLEVDGTESETAVRVSIPTRARTQNRIAAKAASLSGAPGSEKRDELGEFALGGHREPPVEDTPAPVAPAAVMAGVPADHEPENADSLGSFFGPG